jgi:hypothetical protein
MRRALPNHLILIHSDPLFRPSAFYLFGPLCETFPYFALASAALTASKSGKSFGVGVCST